MKKQLFSGIRTFTIVITSLFAINSLIAFPHPSIAADLPTMARITELDPFPQRQPTAPTGSEFLRQTKGMSWAKRERAILAEIKAGNIPENLRSLVPIELSYDGHRATIFVIPDYLAIGSVEDNVIIPMAPRTAMKIASEFGFTLPSAKLVDDIYEHATVQLTPKPMQPGSQMTSNAYYAKHDCWIKSQLPGNHDESELVSGHKKDIVVSPQLQKQPGRLAIYGWHRTEEDPVQPLSLYHGVEYVDYSHGVRLISRVALVDGEWVDLADVYSDPELHPLVSDEGRLSQQYYL